MLTAARNDLLTRVGPGTPMGDLLRRYWQPIGGASELETNPIKAIRLLGAPSVQRGGVEVSTPPGRKHWGLLAYLEKVAASADED